MHLAPPPDCAEVSRVYQSSQDSQGFVMNLTRAWAWRPDVFEGFAALRAQLTNNSSLGKRELAVLVCATASAVGDSYCALAWGKTLAEASDAATAAAVLQSTAGSGLTARDAALAAWARKVVRDPNGTTADEVQALRMAGLTEREIAEATMFVAFRLAFSTFNDALGVSPDRQVAQAAPPAVAAAVTFGRRPDAAAA